MDIPQAMAEYQFKSTIHVIHYYAALQKKRGGGIFNTFNIQRHIMNTSSIFKFTYYFVHRAEKRCILKSLTSNKSCLSKVLGMRIILSLFPNQYPPPLKPAEGRGVKRSLRSQTSRKYNYSFIQNLFPLNVVFPMLGITTLHCECKVSIPICKYMCTTCIH